MRKDHLKVNTYYWCSRKRGYPPVVGKCIFHSDFLLGIIFVGSSTCHEIGTGAGMFEPSRILREICKPGKTK